MDKENYIELLLYLEMLEKKIETGEKQIGGNNNE